VVAELANSAGGVVNIATALQGITKPCTVAGKKAG